MKTEPQPLDVIQGRRQVGVIFKVAPLGMGGRGGWAFKNMDTGRLFTFARLQEAKDEAWKSFAGCIFKRQKPLARIAPYARGTVAEPRAKNHLPSPANIIANVALTTAARAVAGRFMNSLFDDGKGDASATDAGDAMPALTREENPVKIATRAANPGDIHIDIQSHNTKGKNVRAKNPAGDNSRYEVEPYRVWQNTRTGQRQSIFGAAPVWPDHERELVTAGYTIYDTVTGTRGAGRKPFATLEEATEFVARANARDQANVMAIRAARDATPAKGAKKRRKNPASAEKIVLALAGHPKGTGYYTGQTWDTELRKAIRFDSVAGAKAAAKLLAAKLPKGTRIEVRSV